MKLSFGDRMKAYEKQESGRRTIPLMPVYARLDGRSFSRFTKQLKRPYDEDFASVMIEVTKFLVEESQASIGYTVSDEISLAWFQESYDHQIFFDGRLFKMISVLASLASVRFNQLASSHWPEKVTKEMPLFDCRVCQLPNLNETTNMFLWRESEGTRNSVQSACLPLYSHNELDGCSRAEQHDLLHAKGINWNDYPQHFKRGSYIQRQKVEMELSLEQRAKIPEEHRPSAGTLFHRSQTICLDLPQLSQVKNRIGVLFHGEKAKTFPTDIEHVAGLNQSP